MHFEYDSSDNIIKTEDAILDDAYSGKRIFLCSLKYTEGELFLNIYNLSDFDKSLTLNAFPEINIRNEFDIGYTYKHLSDHVISIIVWKHFDGFSHAFTAFNFDVDKFELIDKKTFFYSSDIRDRFLEHLDNFSPVKIYSPKVYISEPKYLDFRRENDYIKPLNVLFLGDGKIFTIPENWSPQPDVAAEDGDLYLIFLDTISKHYVIIRPKDGLMKYIDEFEVPYGKSYHPCIIPFKDKFIFYYYDVNNKPLSHVYAFDKDWKKLFSGEFLFFAFNDDGKKMAYFNDKDNSVYVLDLETMSNDKLLDVRGNVIIDDTYDKLSFSNHNISFNYAVISPGDKIMHLRSFLARDNGEVIYDFTDGFTNLEACSNYVFGSKTRLKGRDILMDKNGKAIYNNAVWLSMLDKDCVRIQGKMNIQLLFSNNKKIRIKDKDAKIIKTYKQGKDRLALTDYLALTGKLFYDEAAGEIAFLEKDMYNFCLWDSKSRRVATDIQYYKHTSKGIVFLKGSSIFLFNPFTMSKPKMVMNLSKISWPDELPVVFEEQIYVKLKAVGEDAVLFSVHELFQGRYDVHLLFDLKKERFVEINGCSDVFIKDKVSVYFMEHLSFMDLALIRSEIQSIDSNKHAVEEER